MPDSVKRGEIVTVRKNMATNSDVEMVDLEEVKATPSKSKKKLRPKRNARLTANVYDEEDKDDSIDSREDSDEDYGRSLKDSRKREKKKAEKAKRVSLQETESKPKRQRERIPVYSGAFQPK